MFRNISINLLVVLSFSFSQEFYDVTDRYEYEHPGMVVKYDLTGSLLEMKTVYQFYENGQKKSETHFKDGVLDGLQTQWYYNRCSPARACHRQKKKEIIYKDGKEISTKSWREDGSVWD